MSSPIHAGTLAPLLPTTDKTPCERVQPGIINWMQAITAGFKWWFKINGEFSAAFVEMVQALECVGGGVILPCPEVSLAGTATPGDTTLALSFNGTRMVAGYDYNIYQSVTEGVFVDPAIVTGVTTGSVINHNVVGLTNGVEYFYKLTVQKPTCDLYEVEISGTPALCKDLLLTLGVVSTGPGVVVLTLTSQGAPIEDTYIYTLYASNLPNQIGSVVDSGAAAGKLITVNGQPALQLQHNAPPVGVPGSGALWYYTLKVQQDPSCFEYSLTQSAFVNDEALAAPVLSFSDLAFRWGAVSGANSYDVYVKATGSCKSDADFVLKAQVAGTTYPFTLANFPCTENFSGTLCVSKWAVRVVARGSNGLGSPPSNQAETPDFIKFPGQCVG